MKTTKTLIITMGLAGLLMGTGFAELITSDELLLRSCNKPVTQRNITQVAKMLKSAPDSLRTSVDRTVTAANQICSQLQ